MVGDRDVASNIFGSMSTVCWIIVYSPQLIENYQLQSGEGLSLLFVYTWLLGDLCNFAGGVIGQLVPTVIILAAYYTVCDTTLLFQVYYYRWKRKAQRAAALDGCPSEQSCLLEERTFTSGEPPRSPLLQVLLWYMGAVVIIALAGSGTYFVSQLINRGSSSRPTLETSAELETQILGWTCTLCYISARVPQIYKNFHTRCEGLAPGLFCFAILGNITFTLSICVASMDRDYLIRNASWIAGSTATVVLDVFVLGQFFYYGYVSRLTVDECGRDAPDY
ncbi:PQ loop repeat-domain-containing protein [Pisolithus croceorrhizus]|nr:PQ loop repeat-domain-containing protein [Pisolithus croceorrhizus]KAI6166653.1 PQ loop repeat-domain-containing protein [Pisolithus thermaeus]